MASLTALGNRLLVRVPGRKMHTQQLDDFFSLRFGRACLLVFGGGCNTSRWWFQRIFIFTLITWGNDPI